MNPEERKEYADRILNNPLWREVLEGIRADLVRAAENTSIGDHESHQAIILSLQLLRSLEAKLTQALTGDSVVAFNQKQQKQVV